MRKRKSSFEEPARAKKNVEESPQYDVGKIHRVDEILGKSDRHEMVFRSPTTPSSFSSCYIIVHPPLQEPIPEPSQEATAATSSTSGEVSTVIPTPWTVTADNMPGTSSQKTEIATTSTDVSAPLTATKLGPETMQDSAETTTKISKPPKVKNTDMTASKSSVQQNSSEKKSTDLPAALSGLANAIESLTKIKYTFNMPKFSTSAPRTPSNEKTQKPGTSRQLRSTTRKPTTLQGPCSGEVNKPKEKKPLKMKLRSPSSWFTAAQASKPSNGTASQKPTLSVSETSTGSLQKPSVSTGVLQKPTAMVKLEKTTTSTGELQVPTKSTTTLQAATKSTTTFQRTATPTARLQKPNHVPKPPTTSENAFKTSLLHSFRKYLKSFMKEYNETVVTDVNLMLCYVFKYEMKNIAQVWKEISDTRKLMSFINEMRKVRGLSITQVRLIFKHIKYFSEFLKLYCCPNGHCSEYYVFFMVLRSFDNSFEIGT